MDMQVLGDSRIIIDWLNNKGKLQVNALECWKDRINELIKGYTLINFTHIYRELNMEADLLSKRALQEQEGKITYHQWKDGQEGPTLFLKLF
jgi:hypothetical protein